MNESDWEETTNGWRCKHCHTAEGMQHRSNCPTKAERAVVSCSECGASADAPHQPTCPTTEPLGQCKQCGRVRATWGACERVDCQHRGSTTDGDRPLNPYDNDPDTAWTVGEPIPGPIALGRGAPLPDWAEDKLEPGQPVGQYTQIVDSTIYCLECEEPWHAHAEGCSKAGDPMPSVYPRPIEEAVVGTFEPKYCNGCGAEWRMEGTEHGAGCTFMPSVLREQATPYDAKPDPFERLKGPLVDLGRVYFNKPNADHLNSLLRALVVRAETMEYSVEAVDDRMDNLENAMGNLELGVQEMTTVGENLQSTVNRLVHGGKPDPWGAIEHLTNRIDELAVQFPRHAKHRTPLPERPGEGHRQPDTTEADRQRMVKAIGMLTELLDRVVRNVVYTETYPGGTLPVGYSRKVDGGAHPLDMDSPPDLRVIIEEQGKELGKAKDTIETQDGIIKQHQRNFSDSLETKVVLVDTSETAASNLAGAVKTIEIQREQIVELTSRLNQATAELNESAEAMEQARKVETDARNTIQGLRAQVSYKVDNARVLAELRDAQATATILAKDLADTREELAKTARARESLKHELGLLKQERGDLPRLWGG